MWPLDTQPRGGAGDAVFLCEAMVAELLGSICHIR
jgi:hypothetical protein